MVLDRQEKLFSLCKYLLNRLVKLYLLDTVQGFKTSNARQHTKLATLDKYFVLDNSSSNMFDP